MSEQPARQPAGPLAEVAEAATAAATNPPAAEAAGSGDAASRTGEADRISDADRISGADRISDPAAPGSRPGSGEPVQGARAERVLAGPPSDYRLTVPDGWERIVLDPDRWAARIERLVARQFRGIDDQPRLRRQITGQMTDRAAAAHANGGVEMYLSLAEVGGVPLPAGLVVTVVAPEPGGALPDLETIGIARGAEGADVSMLDLPAGPALRHRYRDAPRANDPTGSTMPVTHLDFEIAIPNSPLHLLLSFSTSMDPLADVLVELFDTIATTVQWMWMP